MAKPSYPRARRLAETIRRLAGEWLEAEQADQPVPLVTVTDVRVTEDLHHASVFFTVLGDDQQRAAAEAWLADSAPQGPDLRGLAAAAPSCTDARIRSRHRARPGCADRPVAGRAGRAGGDRTRRGQGA